jgi:hypothetical protein
MDRRADPWAGSAGTVTVSRCSSAQGLVSPAYPSAQSYNFALAVARTNVETIASYLIDTH